MTFFFAAVVAAACDLFFCAQAGIDAGGCVWDAA